RHGPGRGRERGGERDRHRARGPRARRLRTDRGGQQHGADSRARRRRRARRQRPGGHARGRRAGTVTRMPRTDTADVIIAGAGIRGVSPAYHLAQLGVHRVAVLERDTVCSGSTALASGGIRHQYANRLGIELTTHSIVTYERFHDEFGVDPHFRQHGYRILIATEEELATARRSVALQQSLGVHVELLDAAATRALCPYLNTDDLLGATYTPRDGY